jgi:hypothetical protein
MFQNLFKFPSNSFSITLCTFKLPYTTTDVCYLTSDHISGMKDNGCYMFMINTDHPSGNGPNGLFCLSKAHSRDLGMVKVLVSSSGIDYDMVDMVWRPNEYPLVRYRYGSKPEKCTLNIRLM